ncbi:MAG: hypothetical protein C5B53_08420 [Candidatus Melainabacteria bacterium]|nr:MAG: hypothetical protein C5B53_08420 [Candidatus Melainabacteria bacterium]
MAKSSNASAEAVFIGQFHFNSLGTILVEALRYRREDLFMLGQNWRMIEATFTKTLKMIGADWIVPAAAAELEN